MNVMTSRTTMRTKAPHEIGLVQRILPVIRRRALFSPGDSILVAVSGGPDSVALLSVLHELRPAWNLTLSVIHINYGLRGRESDADAAFVQRLCDELAVPCVMRRGDSVRQKEPGAGSLQERAREIRYSIVRRMAGESGIKRVALGHSADDQAETVLMWLLRGSGLAGLAGMPAMREGLFIRPLLTIPRADILSYLRTLNREYRTDASNGNPIYFRNKLRHGLVPYMKAIAPSLVRVISRQSEIVGEEDAFMEQMVTDLLPSIVAERDEHVRLARAPFLNVPLALQRRIIRRVLSRLDGRGRMPRFTTVEAIVRQVVMNQAGSRCSARGVEVFHEGESIRIGKSCLRPIERNSSVQECICPEIPGMMVWPPTGERIQLRVVDEHEARNTAQLRDKHMMILDGATFTLPLRLRSWKPGDRISPFGMKGRHKKVQDLFTDLKVTQSVRRNTPILVAPEGILWVVGFRPDGRFVMNPSTRQFVVASQTSQ
ncbi:MAG: tRNA lysidine(34) synthetase TilS [Nitrospiraceae bacterium]